MFDFLGVGKTLKNFALELANIRTEIEVLTREAEDIQYAPASPEDVASALLPWAQRKEKEYGDYLNRVLIGLARQPSVLLSDSHAIFMHLSSSEILPKPSMHLPVSRDAQLCGLLGADAFVALLKQHMQTMDWPVAGLPIAERDPAIKVLQKKISKLRESEASLLKSAEKAGLSVA